VLLDLGAMPALESLDLSWVESLAARNELRFAALRRLTSLSLSFPGAPALATLRRLLRCAPPTLCVLLHLTFQRGQEDDGRLGFGAVTQLTRMECHTPAIIPQLTSLRQLFQPLQ
jgi:hypothetical protein